MIPEYQVSNASFLYGTLDLNSLKLKLLIGEQDISF
jgi:hypothetical protein